MKKSFIWLLLLLFLPCLFLCACTKKEEGEDFISYEDLANIEEVQKDGTLYFEWLKPYNNTKPTIFVFSGEGEDLFSLSLPLSVYTSDVVSPSAGYNGKKIICDSQNTYYDLGYYWTGIASYNVAVFHWEKFASEQDYRTVLAKIYTTYRMRYAFADGNYVDNVFDYPLYKVVTALYLHEVEQKGLATKEIRFLGNGVGAVLAHSVGAYLAETKPDSDYLPYRITLCDAPISEEKLTFSYQNSNDIVSFMKYGNSFLKKKAIALEMIEAKEVSTNENRFAYDAYYSRGADFSELIKDFAYLVLSENYSTKLSFSLYKSKKRIALDWYLLSILGSDDEKVGYPTTYPSTVNNLSTWASNHTRPILNDRMSNNDEEKEIAKYRGNNYAISAWTPTAYIRALRGVVFTQQQAVRENGMDTHFRKIYEYKEYVSETFRTENYQVSDMNYTLICGYLYEDKNENNIIDDGIKMARRGYLTFTVSIDNGATTLIKKTRFEAGEDGFYCIMIVDADKDEQDLNVSQNEKGKVTVTGLSCKDKQYAFRISFVYEKEFTNYLLSIYGSTTYERMFGNGFEANIASVDIRQNNVHGVFIRNCLVVEIKE